MSEDDDDVPMVTRVMPGKDMPSLKDLQGIPWMRLVPAAVLGGLGIGFILLPLFLSFLFPGLIRFFSNFVGSIVLAVPCILIAGFIWKRTTDKERFEGIYVGAVLLVCAVYLVISISFYAGF